MRAPIPVPLTGPISIIDIKNAFPSIDSNSYKDYENAHWYKPSTGQMGTFPAGGPIDDYDFRGLVQCIELHFTTNEFNVNLKSRLPYYYQGVTGVVAYIDAGVKIGSTSSGSPAFVVNGFTVPDGVKIINNGAIKGAGGNGGGAGGYNTYDTVPVHAPVADPGDPGQKIPQPDPATNNPGLYGIYVRGTRQNSPVPIAGTGTPSTYSFNSGVASSDYNYQTGAVDNYGGNGSAGFVTFPPKPSVPAGYYIGKYLGATLKDDYYGGSRTHYQYYTNSWELLPLGYFPLEYWVFRAGKLTYHSIETTTTPPGVPAKLPIITRAAPQPDALGDYQGNVASYKKDGTFIAAYDIPGITTVEKTYHPSSSGSDSGDQGGTALFLNYSTYLINNGSLVGGGGGGGAGAGGSTYGGCCGCGSVHYSGGSGGGGAGYSPGNFDATETVGGAGRTDNGTTGGRGGNPGQAGTGSSGGGGGAAGFAIQNSSFVNGGVGSLGGTITGRT